MKHLSTWFALILIASASLLSVAISASDLKPEAKNQGLAEKQARQTERGQTNAASPIIIVQPRASGTISEPAAKKEQDSADHSHPEATIADEVIAAVTSIYVLVSFFTLRAIKRQSDIAFLIESPWVSVNFTSHIFLHDGTWNPKPWIECWFENHGRTPATLVDSCIEFKFVNRIPEKPIYGVSSPYVPDTIVVPPNGGATRHGQTPYDPAPGDTLHMKDNSYNWLFYGWVRYRDLARAEELAGFGFYSRADLQAGNQRGFFLLDNTEYNYRRKCPQQCWYQRFTKYFPFHFPLPF